MRHSFTRRWMLTALLASPFAGCSDPVTDDANAPGARGGAGDGSGKADGANGPLPAHRVTARLKSGAPRLIEGKLSDDVDAALAVARRIMGPEADESRFAAGDPIVDASGHAHVRYRRMGPHPESGEATVPVLDGDLTLHINAEGVIYAASGDLWPLKIESPKLDHARAVEAAKAFVAPEDLEVSAELPEVLKAPALVYGHHDGEAHLAWQVRATGNPNDNRPLPVDDILLVDAFDGQIIGRRPRIQGDSAHLGRHVFDAEHSWEMESLPGISRRREGSILSGEPTVDICFDYMGVGMGLFNRYAAHVGAELFPDAEEVHAVVHFGQSYNNAFWNGEEVVFGDGDGVEFSNLAHSLDVMCHELGHGLVQFTAGLVYQDESGALNESAADVFGALCDMELVTQNRADLTLTEEDWFRIWAIGETVTTPATPGDALRYMFDPTADGISTDHYAMRFTGPEDNGGVHLNSGIPNLAFYLMIMGGTHPHAGNGVVPFVKVPAMPGALVSDFLDRQPTRWVAGWEMGGLIWLRALTHYLTPDADFALARAAMLRATLDLGYAAHYESVAAAWTAVGVPHEAPALIFDGQTEGWTEPFAGDVLTPHQLTVQVPPGAEALVVELLDGVGDADLYLRHEAPVNPIDPEFDGAQVYSSTVRHGTHEDIRVEAPAPGTWHVLVLGRPGGYSDVVLSARVEEQGKCVVPTLVPAEGAVFSVCPTDNHPFISFDVDVDVAQPMTVRISPDVDQPSLFDDVNLFASVEHFAETFGADLEAKDPDASEALRLEQAGRWNVLVDASGGVPNGRYLVEVRPQPQHTASEVDDRCAEHLPAKIGQLGGAFTLCPSQHGDQVGFGLQMNWDERFLVQVEPLARQGDLFDEVNIYAALDDLVSVSEFDVAQKGVGPRPQLALETGGDWDVLVDMRNAAPGGRYRVRVIPQSVDSTVDCDNHIPSFLDASGGGFVLCQNEDGPTPFDVFVDNDESVVVTVRPLAAMDMSLGIDLIASKSRRPTSTDADLLADMVGPQASIFIGEPGQWMFQTDVSFAPDVGPFWVEVRPALGPDAYDPCKAFLPEQLNGWNERYTFCPEAHGTQHDFWLDVAEGAPMEFAIRPHAAAPGLATQLTVKAELEGGAQPEQVSQVVDGLHRLRLEAPGRWRISVDASLAANAARFLLRSGYPTAQPEEDQGPCDGEFTGQFGREGGVNHFCPATEGEFTYFYVVVEPNHPMKVRVEALLTGDLFDDVDLYGRVHELADLDNFDVSSKGPGFDEEIILTEPGTWDVMVHAPVQSGTFRLVVSPVE
ncbi:MAG: M4 family metallopeptidase [Bradymonadia bacterium]